MKENATQENSTISELETALDRLNKTAARMRPGSFPSVQLHRLAAALEVVLQYVQLNDSPMETEN